jgi:UDP-N-acetylglucosamine acyltransferase
MSAIHPTAIISDGAVIGEGSTVGPYSIIGPNVVMGRNNRIGPHVVIEGHTTIGDENGIFQFASVGAAPQDLKFRGEPSRLTIGNANFIREFVTLQPGTSGGGMLTSIGDGNLFMANSHVGHDAHVGSHNVFANSAALAGHVIVGSYTTIGGLVGIHQFVKLGDLCFLGAGSMVTRDVPPFCIGQGDRAGLAGINKVGALRRGYSNEETAALKRLYREIFFGEGTMQSRIETARKTYAGLKPGIEMLDFIQASKRGVTMPRGRGKQGDDEE